MSKLVKQCPRCGTESTNDVCCGIRLRTQRFKLTADKIQRLRGMAHGQKGLTHEQYHDRLFAEIGVRSTKDIRRGRDYLKIFNSIKALPDVPRRRVA